jgi:hypothetical protein
LQASTKSVCIAIRDHKKEGLPARSPVLLDKSMCFNKTQAFIFSYRYILKR